MNKSALKAPNYFKRDVHEVADSLAIDLGKRVWVRYWSDRTPLPTTAVVVATVTVRTGDPHHTLYTTS